MEDDNRVRYFVAVGISAHRASAVDLFALSRIVGMDISRFRWVPTTNPAPASSDSAFDLVYEVSATSERVSEARGFVAGFLNASFDRRD